MIPGAGAVGQLVAEDVQRVKITGSKPDRYTVFLTVRENRGKSRCRYRIPVFYQ